MLPVPTFVVVCYPHPMVDKRDPFAMGQGCSVEDAILEAAYRQQMPVEHFAECVAIVDDQVIPKAQWSTVRPHPGQQLIIRIVPGAVFVPLFFSALAAAAPGIAGLTAGTLGAIALSAGISIVGALVSMALSPAPRQQTSRPDRKEGAVYSIQGVQNQARPYGTIPRVFGRIVNYYPPLGAAQYTEIAGGNHQYLRFLVCLGYGPVQISDIKLGSTPIANFENVTLQIREGYPDDDPITLFPAQVREQTLNIQLRQSNGYSERRSEPDTDEISLDVVFPSGLQRISNRNVKFVLEVEFEVQYKAATSSTWAAADITADAKNVTLSGPGRFTVRGYTKALLRRTIRVELPSRGRYDVKIRRLTTDDQSDNEGKDQSVAVDDSYWSAFRSHRNEHPVNTTGLAFIAGRIRASDQLNGAIDQLNCTVQAVLPVWNGATWTDTATRSPAWAFCEVLRGAANGRAVADARIDLDQMIDFDDFCGANGVMFDGVFEDRASVFERLQDIAATAYASFCQSQGPFTVVIDNERDTPVQHFTPRNSRAFSSTKVLANRPHALKVRFPNALTLRQWDEIYVYESGYNAGNATIFESVELPYTSTARQAYRRARHMIFAARLRPEIYSIEVDNEHLTCTRGDLVRVSHDVPLLGVGAARVKALATSGADTTGVTLDAPLEMDGAESYAIRFRLATGESLLVPVNTVAGAQTEFEFTTAVATASGPAVGDLALFGISGTESVEMIVRSIEPLDELGARITLVDYSPEIFTSATGTIPEFDPQITLPTESTRGIPAAPSITSIDSSEAVLARASDGTLTSRILVGFTVNNADAYVTAEFVQLRYRVADSDTDYLWVPQLPAQGGAVYLSPVDDGETYEIEIRSIFAGVPSAWTTTEHTVVGKTTPPPDVDRLYRQGGALTWPYPDPPIDFAGFLVRANYGTSSDWGTGRPLHEGIITAPPFDISALHGTQCIMVKAVDTSGIVSANAAMATIDLGDVYVENVIDTQSEAPTFGGTITGGTVSGGVLEADMPFEITFWGSPDYLHWHADGDPYWVDVYSDMTYTATWTPASDQLNDATLKIDTTVVGDYTIDYRISTSATFWGSGGSAHWGTDTDAYWDEDEIGEFTTWPGQIGPFDTVANTYEFRITVAGGAAQGSISQFDILVDVPDIEELYEDVQITVAASGVRLTPAAARRAIDVVNVTLQDDGGAAVTIKIIDKNATTGALIKAYNAAGSVTTATFDARTKAH